MSKLDFTEMGNLDAFAEAAKQAAERNDDLRSGNRKRNRAKDTDTVDTISASDTDAIGMEPGSDAEGKPDTDAIGTVSASDADSIVTTPGNDVSHDHVPENVSSPATGKASRRKTAGCERYRMEISIPLSVRKELEDVSARTGVPMSSLLVQAWYGKSLRDERRVSG